MSTETNYKTCSVPDCDKALLCKGLCKKHYSRLNRTGSLDLSAKKEIQKSISKSPFKNRNKLLEENKSYCSKCKTIKPSEEFSLSIRSPHRLSYICRVCAKEKGKLDRKKFGDKYKSSIKNYRLESRYSITLSEFNRMIEVQNGLCAICHKEFANRINVDHDHQTGRVRELLCVTCNTNLGIIENLSSNSNKDLLIKIIKYMRKHNSLSLGVIKNLL